MYVTGGNHRFVKLFSQFYNPLVDRLNILHGMYIFHPFRRNHKFVVTQGLNFQIVIKVYNPADFRIRLAPQHRLVQLAGFTGAAQQYALPVLLKQALGNSGPSGIIGQMGFRYHRIQIHSAHVILRQHNGMIGRHSFHRVRAAGAQGIDVCQPMDAFFLQHGNKFDKYLRRGLCIIHRTVMVFQGNTQGFGHRIQCMFCLVRKQQPGNPHRIHAGKCTVKPQPPRIFRNKTHIKGRIMGHQHTFRTESQKIRQNLFNPRRVHHILIPDTGELFNPIGYGCPGIDKGGKPLCDFPIGYFYSANFDNPVAHRRKTGCLQVKHHEIPGQRLIFAVHNHLFQIIHQIGFHTIDHFEKVLWIRIFFPCLFPSRLFSPPQIFPHMVCIRKRLYDTVISDGDGRMAPFPGPFDNILCIRHAVHIAHLRMAVQFHPLPGAVVHPSCGKIGRLFDSRYRAQCQFAVKLINGGHTF